MTVRPALVIARRKTDGLGDLLWVLMITNAERPAWPGDVPIENAPARGLIIPSKVRTAKVSTVAADATTKLGVIDDKGYARVRGIILDTFNVY